MSDSIPALHPSDDLYERGVQRIGVFYSKKSKNRQGRQERQVAILSTQEAKEQAASRVGREACAKVIISLLFSWRPWRSWRFLFSI